MGRLTAVPWAALPGDRPGTVLLEQYALATVPHAPFLLDRLTAPPRPTTDDRGLVLAVGGVAYDQAPKPVDDEKTRLELLAAAPGRDRGAAAATAGASCPGTLQELDAVTQLAAPATSSGSRGPRRARPGCSASCPAPAGPTSPPTASSPIPASARSCGPIPSSSPSIGRERVGAGLRNPLVLSGLVLAGANRPAARRRRLDRATTWGILTAEAIAGLPLQDLELVVLSACETGLGLVGGGEGVFGLQRAFHLAGAHNVVASLWKVDDEATAALMAIFYDQLWRQNKPPIEALRAAQLTLYHHPELVGELAQARGTPDFDKLVQRPEPVAGQRRAGAATAPTRRTGRRSSSRAGGR